MSTSAVIEIDTTNADRCNRQAHVVPTDTHVKFGDVTLALGPKVYANANGFDVYEVTFVGAATETATFSSAFVATYFLEQALLNKAATMAKATGSVGATVHEEYHDPATGNLVVLGVATWKRS